MQYSENLQYFCTRYNIVVTDLVSLEILPFAEGMK